MRKIATTILAGAALLAAGVAAAEPTGITVRVLSKDAKFVGTSMGGVRITLRDAHTGETLATGLTRGGTGDTGRLMHEDGGRRAGLADASAAAFETTLDLDAPRLVEVEAYGPLAQPQAAHRIVSTQWVVPGRDITGGDGWVLELPGFVVDVLAPPAHIKLSADTASVPVTANVTMMCGCPIEPGGLWDADDYEVTALVRRDGGKTRRVALDYAGETSRFGGEIRVDGPGVYDVTVYAHDPGNGNTGLDRTTFIVNR
ncbi:hypothetical protein PC39_10087 [Salinisphaera sp. PC39]|uniref:hypothetical protein n=1 Tax=Salinisphaera sp. PC39 TaxID=1304156 RepID=UPI00333FEF87